MIQTTPEGNKLLYQLIPVDVVFHFSALAVFVFFYSDLMSRTETLICAGAISGANIARLVLVLIIKGFVDPKAEGHGKVISSLLLVSSVVTGLCWSGSLIYLDWQVPEFSFNDNLVTIMLSGLIMASLVGSALWSWLFLAFTLPTISAPIAWFVYNSNYAQLPIWGFYAVVASILFWVITRAEAAFIFYRNVGKQNTGLLKELANAKEQAQRQHYEVERAHNSLKAEMKEREKIEEKIRASERETTRILRDMQDTYFRVDAKGIIKRLSPSVTYLLGHSPENLMNTRFAELFVSSTDYLKLSKELQDSCGAIENYEVRLRHALGHELWASFNAHLSGAINDEHQGFEGTIRDVTDSKGAAEALFQEKERLHVTLESIGDGVITTDIKGTVVYMNPIAERMTGWRETEAKGIALADVMKIIDETNSRPLNLPLHKWLRDGKHGKLSNPAILKNKKDDRTSTIELSGSPIRDSNGKVIGAVLVFHNVTKLRTLAKQLSYQASHDALTGLINRTEFETRVQHAIRSAQNEDKQHALFYVDLDQFKIVNDTCGHHAGDELLKQVTALMQDKLRASDTLARLGGDEFGVLLVGCDITHAEKVAENIRSAVEKFRFVWEDHIFRIGTSIGLVSISRETQSLTELLSAADSACYVAKEGGRNMVHTYTRDDEAVAKQHGQMQWKERIQKALEEDRFELHFQPIAAVSGIQGKGMCGEILLRMIDENKDAENQLIMPGAFMPSAERYQLMPEIDRWVIKNTLEALSEKLPIETWDTCFINLSGQSLSDPKLLDFILAHLKRYKVPGKYLCFEITESAMIANFENANRLIAILKKMGCRFALDDFGSGVSSFVYLKNLSVDYLKLDGEIVKDVTSDKAGYAMVHAINQVAHVMDMKTIAEHVETQGIFDALKRLGADFAQGFGIAYPQAFRWHRQRHSKVS